METLYYLIPLFIILLCMMPICITVKGSYNVFKNRGALGIFIFGKKIKSLRFVLSHMSIKIYEEGECKEEDINFESKEAILTKNLISEVKEKTKLKLLRVNYNIGIGNAFQTAMICGFINFAILTFFTRLKCAKPTASLLVCDNIAYNQTVFETAVTLKASISLFDLVYSFINSVILSIKQKQ